MNKLIYRKLSYDILIFFLIASFCISIIIWVIQAVNYLEIVSDDGHSLKTYFTYTLLSLPKIFTRTIVFVFFLSIFIILNKYETQNEILVFWINGLKKINLINFILRFSILFVICQIFLNLFVVPPAQNLGRDYLKVSNIDFLPKLITKQKFIDVAKNLTMFVEDYDDEGNLYKVYIKEELDNQKSKIITSNNGKIIQSSEGYILKLFDGGIINLALEKTYNLNFSSTEYDLSNFSPKTITHQKIQETETRRLFLCLVNKYFETNNEIEPLCTDGGAIEQIAQEMFKRSILPLYIFVISLVASSLIISPKNKFFGRFHKVNIFICGVGLIIFSQFSSRFIDGSLINDMIISLIPITLILLYYLIIFIKTNFNLTKL
tara:strand:+ start:750 stop:1877 length:1128 start_codon:yes stop_codon:yes gene_type:complete